MANEIVTERSLRGYVAAIVMGLLLMPLLGFFLGQQFAALVSWDWIMFLTYFFGLPLLVSAIAFVIGWQSKRGAVKYSPPEWKYKPVQMSIEDAVKLPSEYNRRYHRLVANSNYWMFFIPVVLITLAAFLPLYVFYEAPSLGTYLGLIYGVLLAALYMTAILGGYLATSNEASADFTLPLIREAVKLAKKQQRVPGIASISIVMDMAEESGLKIYSEPRVLIRIKGLENKAYIESWSGEVNSVEKMLLRLYASDDHPQTVWWWVAHDRTFRKYTHPDDTGYYVEYPVRSRVKHPGVKDIELLTMNGVAIIIREWLYTRGDSDELRSILEALNSKPVQV
ncbi:MAG: hypothetical protein ACP6KW_00780 [Candidatus Thorarchaeota archaeon]